MTAGNVIAGQASLATSPRSHSAASLAVVSPAAIWIRRLAAFGCVLCVVVVVLGAWVRLTDAGLGCPDWPGCYGHATPSAAAQSDSHLEPQFQGARGFDEGKAWREMIHRYAASTLGFVIVLIAALAVAYRRIRPVSPAFGAALLSVVLLQGLLGAFTVWWLVKPLVVVLHLLGGLTTLALLFWLWMTMRRRTGVVTVATGATRTRALDAARTLGVAALAVLALQIALGGWTSSNYAAVSCPDFPRCQGQWIPQSMDYADAYVLWRGLDIDYTGGVLEHPARVAIHFTHRLGAIVATLVLVAFATLAWRHATTPLLRTGSAWLAAALLLQLVIGVLMIWRGFPLLLATGHNAGAAVLLLAALALNRRLREA